MAGRSRVPPPEARPSAGKHKKRRGSASQKEGLPRRGARQSDSVHSRPASVAHSRTAKEPRAKTHATRRSDFLELPERLEAKLMAGHPWVYREQIPADFSAAPGSWVKIQCGRVEGYALWDSDSDLALRIFSRHQRPDAQWFLAQIRAAWQLRAATLNQTTTNAFRWLNGEADGIPGFIVDYYAGYAVIVLDSPQYESLLAPVVAALTSATQLKGVVRRRRGGDTTASSEKKIELLHGRLPPKPLVVLEHGLRFQANLYEGQKTGLFLDHRENRLFIERFSEGRRVLNLFSYSGAFSLYAARGGAKQVTSVDISPGAAEDAAENFRLNGFEAEQHEFIVADVFEYLETCRKQGRQFDLVVCDPPSFARNQAQLKRALNAYTRVNAAAIKVVSDDGWFAAASCTGRVSRDAFADSLATSARRAGKLIRIIADNGHAADHPVSAAHPEMRYLKFLFGRVHPRA